MNLSPNTLAYIREAEFSLYNGCTEDPAIEKLAQEGNAVGRDLLEGLMIDLAEWEKTYRMAGASDTAARETMAVHIAKLLGLKGYADQP